MIDRLRQLRALTSLRYFARHRAQWLLALVGVATGVAAVVAVGLARASVQAAFDASSTALSGTATHSILSDSTPLTRETYAMLRRSAGHLPMAPRLRASVTRDDGTPWTLLGVDPLRETAFARAGAGATDAPGFPTAAWFLGEPLVILPSGTAKVGDSVSFSAGSRKLTGEVAALFETAAADTARVIVADIGRVGRWLDRDGELDAIDLVATDADLADLRPLLPAGARIEAIEKNTAGLTQAFDLNLTALSLMTALVGAFIVFNTFNFLVLQRRDLFVLEHRLGVPLASQRRQVLAEALATGICGSSLGVVAGVVLGEVTLRITRRTVSNLYFDVSGAALQIDARVLGAGFAVGLLSCIGAALWPARRIGSSASRPARPGAAILAGLAAILATGLTLLLTPTGLFGALLGVFLTALAYAALGAPLLSRITEPVVRASPLGTTPLLGLSLRRLPRSIDRMLPAATALTLAIATVVGVGTMIDSFRTTVVGWLTQSLTADYYVASDGRPLSAAERDRISALPGVRAISRFATLPARIDDLETQLAALDLPPEGFAGFAFLAGNPESVRRGFEDGTVALVSEALARRSGLEPGRPITVQTGRGVVQATVGGVMADYRAGAGRVTMSWKSVERQLGPLPLRSVGLYFGPGVVAADVEPAVTATLSDRTDLRFSDTVGIRTTSMSIFDQTFEITRALQWIAAVVALVGLTGSLMALQLDRRRELRLLEALGVTAREQGRALRLEATLIGLVVCLFAMPLGLLLAWALTAVINLRAFGWQLAPDFVGPALALGPAVALGGAWLAGTAAARLGAGERGQP